MYTNLIKFLDSIKSPPPSRKHSYLGLEGVVLDCLCSLVLSNTGLDCWFLFINSANHMFNGVTGWGFPYLIANCLWLSALIVASLACIRAAPSSHSKAVSFSVLLF